ncbi:hypothetical protein SAMN04489832_1718 [Micromonospora cremea]|uniref:Uncharacterized protein n=1 Tax=Micromonospora cremea TaxID=709881 RepID=A0A1N5VNE4_9ACTN|nr:hypothetical protein SAMN04489832_1718 [Micromonospora cremea]
MFRDATRTGDNPADSTRSGSAPHTVRYVKDRGFRKFVTVLAGLAVIYFGTAGRSPEEGRGISGGLVVLALLAALLVWHLTRPGDKTVK